MQHILVTLAAALVLLAATAQEESQSLSVAFKGPRFVYVNRTVEYTIGVANKESKVAKDAEVVCWLPANLEYVSSSPKGAYQPASQDAPASIAWNPGDVQPEGVASMAVTLRAKKAGTCRTVVMASVGSGTSVSKAGSDFAILKVSNPPAMHISTYDTEDPVECGKCTIYVIETRNEGTAPCTNVKLECRIPEQMEFVSAEGPKGSKSGFEDGKLRFEAVPVLEPGDKLVFKVTCKAVKAGSARNQAFLTYDQFDKPILDEEGTSVYN